MIEAIDMAIVIIMDTNMVIIVTIKNDISTTIKNTISAIMITGIIMASASIDLIDIEIAATIVMIDTVTDMKFVEHTVIVIITHEIEDIVMVIEIETEEIVVIEGKNI